MNEAELGELLENICSAKGDIECVYGQILRFDMVDESGRLFPIIVKLENVMDELTGIINFIVER